MNIFKSKNNNINSFVKKNPRNKALDEYEINILYAFNLIEEKYKIKFNTLIVDSVCKTCLFKLNNNWIVWDTDEVGRFYNYEKFTTVFDACKNTIDRYFMKIISRQKNENQIDMLLYQWSIIIDELDELCMNEYDKQELERYASLYGYNITKENVYVLQKTRK